MTTPSLSSDQPCSRPRSFPTAPRSSTSRAPAPPGGSSRWTKPQPFSPPPARKPPRITSQAGSGNPSVSAVERRAQILAISSIQVRNKTIKSALPVPADAQALIHLRCRQIGTSARRPIGPQTPLAPAIHQRHGGKIIQYGRHGRVGEFFTLVGEIFPYVAGRKIRLGAPQRARHAIFERAK